MRLDISLRNQLQSGTMNALYISHPLRARVFFLLARPVSEHLISVVYRRLGSSVPPHAPAPAPTPRRSGDGR